MELRVENEAKSTYTWQLSASSNTTTAKKLFYNVVLKCFQNHCLLLKSQKQTTAFFKVCRRFFLVLNWTIYYWRGKKTSFARDEKARFEKKCKKQAKGTNKVVEGSNVCDWPFIQSNCGLASNYLQQNLFQRRLIVGWLCHNILKIRQNRFSETREKLAIKIFNFNHRTSNFK